MRTVVIIPTYNERENVLTLLPQVFAALEKATRDGHVLVMDDTSPDGTADAVRGLQGRYPRLHLELGKKEGFGRAYARGFRHALERLHADIVVTMDADHSHDPARLPELLERIEAGADVAIASRYVPGGGTPDWPWTRKLTSFGANTLARVLGGLYRVHDCTGGYRAIRATLLRKLDPASLDVRGYVLQITLLHALVLAGAKVAEIPLVFHDRKVGKTKLHTRDKAEFFWTVAMLRLRTSKRLIKFGLVGASGILVNLGLLAFFVERMGIEELVASPIAIEVSIVWNFLLNYHWTFRKTSNRAAHHIKFLKFQVTALLGLAINWGVFAALLHLGALHYLLAQFIGILCAFLWNYLMNVHWTWREEPLDAVQDQRKG